MSKLLTGKIEIRGRDCIYAALLSERRLLEFQFQPAGEESILDNIYIGQIDKMADNIHGAFVKIAPQSVCYCDYKELEHAVCVSPRKGGKLRPGDEILVQVSRDAMKTKLPSVTTNLSLKGRYLLLTTGKPGLGLSAKLDTEAKRCLKKWLQEESFTEHGLVVRTNAAEATKQQILNELEELKNRRQRLLQQGRSRTCFSLLEKREPFYLEAIRSCRQEELEEIVTDDRQLYGEIKEFQERLAGEAAPLRLYEDKFLPLEKLYNLKGQLSDALKEKVWLKSGAFLLIQPTEAFVSIDVNTGKFIGKKKAEETYRKINLEAAEEIARQLRLRNLSGMILIDFINMKNPDHEDELLHVLAKHLRKDSQKAIVHDMTMLKIVEVTRKKVRRPLYEDVEQLGMERKDENI